MELRPENDKVETKQRAEGRDFQAEGVPGTKAQESARTWHTQGHGCGGKGEGEEREMKFDK